MSFLHTTDWQDDLIEEREARVELLVNKGVGNREYCYMWILGDTIKVVVYGFRGRSREHAVRWERSYEKSILDLTNEEIAMQILLDYTFSAGNKS